MHDANETPANHQLIMTADPAAGGLALGELRELAPDTRLLAWLAPGVGLAALGVPWRVLAKAVRARPPVFLRHICPVQAWAPLRGDLDDLEALAGAAEALLGLFRRGMSFSVQARLLGEGWPYGRYDVNTRLAAFLAEQGFSLDVRQPQQVLAAVLAGEAAYLGVSLAEENLSSWAGGERRFKRESGQISRAEFKLLEAIESFGLALPERGVALDLGAAPGGWTRILRQGGLGVVAVDPADLHPRLAADPGVQHVRALAYDYLRESKGSFDVILNDMRMDALDSARLTLAAAERLAPQGWALLTLKLPEHDMGRVAAEALALLSQRATILGARQLFHNRNEVTVALGRRKDDELRTMRDAISPMSI
jgi:23S rRNA (cytidine2498-2'-O)-methyltransferase